MDVRLAAGRKTCFHDRENALGVEKWVRDEWRFLFFPLLFFSFLDLLRWVLLLILDLLPMEEKDWNFNLIFSE